MSQSPKIKWDNSTEKLKNMCGRPTRKKAGWHSPRRKKIWFRDFATFAIVTSKYNWNSSTNKTETSKGQTGKQAFKTARRFKVSLSEKNQIEQIKDTSICHTKYWSVLVQESPNSSLRQLQGAISREYRKK